MCAIYKETKLTKHKIKNRGENEIQRSLWGTL